MILVVFYFVPYYVPKLGTLGTCLLHPTFQDFSRIFKNLHTNDTNVININISDMLHLETSKIIDFVTPCPLKPTKKFQEFSRILKNFQDTDVIDISIYIRISIFCLT